MLYGLKMMETHSTILTDESVSVSTKTWESIEGSTYPLGVTYIRAEEAFNFAVYSRHATEVELLIFSADELFNPVFSYTFDYRFNKSNRIWHCRINARDIQEGRYYGYRIDGPPAASQFEWHKFDKQKILLDPYARSVFFPKQFSKEAACGPGDNIGRAPLGIIPTPDEFDWENDAFVSHQSDLIIYELHVKGFTFHPSSGLGAEKGSFSGIVKRIPYLKELGITAVELMPVHQFDISAGYWGYNTLNFFAPHSKYSSFQSSNEQIAEFKTMVRELHKAEIEVILDVVYNHTCEGDHLGPVYSYKGIDNSTYYLISQDSSHPYYDFTGTGNTMHTRNSSVRRMILDSLHYWRSEMHVDGFRFDLASVFNRNLDGSISFEEPAILGMISSDPDLATARFIAEPWDVSGAFYLGKKFPGVKWMQWNSAFRDDVRRFVKGDPGFTEAVKKRIYGSDDIFPDTLEDAFHPYQSINYINSHDGFTLYDLVSYNNKHNSANGENNRDGANENFSWNCGLEGDQGLTPEILQLRKKQAKNLSSILFLSNGTPMFVAGDEFLRTQGGNNNPYNQDNETSWIDWICKDRNSDFFIFFKKLIQFRKAHPSLSRSRFWRNDVQWFREASDPDNVLSFYLRGGVGNDTDIYVMMNLFWQSKSFSFQIAGPWNRVINTALLSPEDFVEENEDLITESSYLVKERSICVFVKPPSQ